MVLSKRLLYILLIWLLAALPLSAEIVVLRSGGSVEGEILLNNDEVVILRTKDGKRYQYPQSEVLSIENDKSDDIFELYSLPTVCQRNVSTQLYVSGGSAYIPYQNWGGIVDVGAMIGAPNLMDKHIFLGGSIGCRAVFGKKNTYLWVPAQLVCQMPLLFDVSSLHYPVVGFSIGYSFATNQEWGHGACAGVDVGWKYQINTNSSLFVALAAQWQQTQFSVEETINQIQYTNRIGCSIVGLGIKLNIQF